MHYTYETERHNIFTEEGQILFLKIRDNTDRLLKLAGAARWLEMVKGCCGDSFTMLACVDRLVELGEIYCVTEGQQWMSQHHVYIRKSS